MKGPRLRSLEQRVHADARPNAESRRPILNKEGAGLNAVELKSSQLKFDTGYRMKE